MTEKKLTLRFGDHAELTIFLNKVTLYRGSDNPSTASTAQTPSEVSPIGEAWSAVSVIPVTNIGSQYIKVPPTITNDHAIKEYKRDQDKKAAKWQLDMRKLIPQATQVVMIAAKQVRDSSEVNELTIDIEEISKDLARFHREFANNLIRKSMAYPPDNKEEEAKVLDFDDNFEV